MKHSNHDETSKHRGVADQQKKGKGQNERVEAMNQQDRQSRGTRDHSGAKGGDTTNWQKEKQGNKK
jgi:hypothetical protein